MLYDGPRPIQGYSRLAGTRTTLDQRRTGKRPVGKAAPIIVQVQKKPAQRAFGVTLQVLGLDEQLVGLAGKLLDFGRPQGIYHPAQYPIWHFRIEKLVLSAAANELVVVVLRNAPATQPAR